MIDDLSSAITGYKQKWETLVNDRANKDFFSSLKPTSVGWKTVDLQDFNARFSELRDLCDQIHFGWVNERWLVTMRLKNQELPFGLTVVKLMQRRPGSNDATGLDHLDFYYQPGSDVKSILKEEPSLKWSEETNGDHCKWVSVWFGSNEAKLRSDTVLDVCAAELRDAGLKLTKK